MQAELKEDEKEFLMLLGFLHLRYGKWNNARILFEALRALYPDDPSFAKSLSFACLKSDDYSKGLEQAESFLQAARETVDLETGLLLKCRALWGLGDPEGARESFERACEMGKRKG